MCDACSLLSEVLRLLSIFGLYCDVYVRVERPIGRPCSDSNTDYKSSEPRKTLVMLCYVIYSRSLYQHAQTPLFPLCQCQSQAWIKHEGSVASICFDNWGSWVRI